MRTYKKIVLTAYHLLLMICCYHVAMLPKYTLKLRQSEHQSELLLVSPDQEVDPGG